MKITELAASGPDADLWILTMHALNIFEFKRTRIKMSPRMRSEEEDMTYEIVRLMESTSALGTSAVMVSLSVPGDTPSRLRLSMLYAAGRSDVLWTSQGFVTSQECVVQANRLLEWLDAEGKVLV